MRPVLLRLWEVQTCSCMGGKGGGGVEKSGRRPTPCGTEAHEASEDGHPVAMRLRELLRAPRKSGVRPSNEWVPFAHCRGIFVMDGTTCRKEHGTQARNVIICLAHLLSPSSFHPQ